MGCFPARRRVGSFLPPARERSPVRYLNRAVGRASGRIRTRRNVLARASAAQDRTRRDAEPTQRSRMGSAQGRFSAGATRATARSTQVVLGWSRFPAPTTAADWRSRRRSVALRGNCELCWLVVRAEGTARPWPESLLPLRDWGEHSRTKQTAPAGHWALPSGCGLKYGAERAGQADGEFVDCASSAVGRVIFRTQPAWLAFTTLFGW